jgi:hypothetical protein
MLNREEPNLNIPERYEDVTAEWLTEALRSGGVIGDQTVSKFEVHPLGTEVSRTSSLARITVEYDGQSDGLPNSMFAKFPSRLPNTRKLVAKFGIFQREISLYSDLGNAIPMNTPKLYFGFAPEGSDAAVIVLEEIIGFSKESLPTEEQRILTVGEARLALGELAKMHAKWWDDPTLDDYEWLRGVDHVGRNFMYQSYEQTWAKMREIVEPALDPTEVRICNGLSNYLPTLMSELKSMPTTLSHGDFHPGNLLWDKLGEPKTVWVIDWQFPSRAPGVIDVARILGMGVESANLHLVRQDYLPQYHSALVSGGVTGYEYERFLNDYRHGLLENLIFSLTAFAVGDYARDDIVEFVRIVIGNFTTAAVDAGCADLIS